MSVPWLKERDGALVLMVRVHPGARRTEVVGPLGDWLKIRVSSPPVDGAANSALAEFIADLFNLRRSQVEVVKGLHSRSKVLNIMGISQDAALAVIENSYPK